MASPAPEAQPAPGRLTGIYLRERKGGASVAVDRAQAIAGRGLEGDRYSIGAGSFSDRDKPGRELTLVEAEALEALERETGIALEPDQTGRNLLTAGVSLNELVGRRFFVGSIECVGTERCEPCRTLERRTVTGVLKGLAGRGGLRADILVGGEIAVGDRVELEAA